MSKPAKENKSSKLLTPEENQLVFSLIGKKRLSQSTSVVELYMADPPHYSQWSRYAMGVLCFIKDNIRRSYFMRLYCLKQNHQIWEHEIYDELQFCQPRPYLLIFEGSPSIICINFVSEVEAEKFGLLLYRYLENRKKKVGKNSIVRTPTSTYVDQSIVKDIPDVIVKSQDKVKRKRGIRKEDIGLPTNFVHLESGTRDTRLKEFLERPTEARNDTDQKLDEFLQQAGVTKRMLSNRKTREAVQSFIEENQVLEKIHRHHSTVIRPAPKAPHPAPKAPQIPARPGTLIEKSFVNKMQISPPPPPPTPIMTDTFTNHQLSPIDENESVSSNRSDFLSEIHNGFELKSVSVSTQEKTYSDPRNELLEQIRGNRIQLKSVKERRDDSPRPKDQTHDLARAMHDALNVILVANQNSSDEEMDDETFDNWDDE